MLSVYIEAVCLIIVIGGYIYSSYRRAKIIKTFESTAEAIKKYCEDDEKK